MNTIKNLIKVILYLIAFIFSITILLSIYSNFILQDKTILEYEKLKIKYDKIYNKNTKISTELKQLKEGLSPWSLSFINLNKNFNKTLNKTHCRFCIEILLNKRKRRLVFDMTKKFIDTNKDNILNIVTENEESYQKIISYMTLKENYLCKIRFNHDLPYTDKCNIFRKFRNKATSFMKYLLIKDAYIKPNLSQFKYRLNQYSAYLKTLYINNLTLVDRIVLKADTEKYFRVLLWIQSQVNNNSFLNVIKSSIRKIPINEPLSILEEMEVEFLYRSKIAILVDHYSAIPILICFIPNLTGEIINNKWFIMLNSFLYYTGIEKMIYQVNDTILTDYKLLKSQSKDISRYALSDKNKLKRKHWNKEINSITYFSNPVGRSNAVADGNPPFEKYIINFIESLKVQHAFKKYMLKK